MESGYQGEEMSVMRNSGWLLSVALLLGVLAFHNAYAEQGCPDGFTPNAAGTPGMQCIPIGGQTRPGSPSTASEQWSARWGAIAADNASGKTGLMGNMTSRRKAESGALAICKRKGGSNCELKLTYYNQCGVMAWGDGKMSTASAPTIEEASDLALTECRRLAKDCDVYFSDCSYAKRVR
ncbi:DUF4189 domain-containing protein [Lysobacter enzymogenes]|uniref:DUF4189 domain-containing protein n=1 Tax=Lysobacter enzymogenes TaxID=69 RepID=UPI00384BF4A7